MRSTERIDVRVHYSETLAAGTRLAESIFCVSYIAVISQVLAETNF
jgi:hypothetical protein